MSPGERKVFSYFWRGTGEILLYALPVNSGLKVEVSVGVGKATCIVKGKRPLMRRLRESGLFTVAN